MPGVTDATCVYVGGEQEWPTYGEIKDHTEGVTVRWDSLRVSYADLLAVFMANASSLTEACSSYRQYMTGVWFHSEEQRRVCDEAFGAYEKSHGVKVQCFRGPLPAAGIYRAEEYHQRYFEKNGGGW